MNTNEMLNSANYEQEGTLGAGAFGVVYRVRSYIDGKIYAAKRQKLVSPDAVRIVKNEIDVLKNLDRHPNVIAYYGSWTESGANIILMEYASEGSLESIMKERRRGFSEKTALFVFAQIVLGVNHIHRQSIIHRDLKPANILVQSVARPNGKRMGIIKIGDFGVSRDTYLSVARTAAGTISYMAPEVFHETQYDSRCDMWSCGVILYELLTNTFPFKASNNREMIDQIQEGRYEKISSEDISENTSDIVSNLLRVNPTQRLRSRDIVNRSAIKEVNDMIGDHLRGSSKAWCNCFRCKCENATLGEPRFALGASLPCTCSDCNPRDLSLRELIRMLDGN